ncbi:hypothetical protein [Actinokineospora sp.]|uniref:hypothetical protein n=1 Tax=Actinokineospora sp. TaxID=1872133 RepID=UPI003D6A12B9
MDRVKTEKTTAAMRRVLSRSLMVLGGAVATTAAAWAISSASATADTSFDFPVFPSEGTQSAPAPMELPVVSDLTGSIGRIIGESDPNFGEHAKEAFDEFGHKITEHFEKAASLPVDAIDDVDDVEIPGVTDPGVDAPDGSAVTAPVAGVPVAKATTLVGVRPGAIDQNAVAGALERALADGMNRRGSPETSDEAPVMPRGTSPLAPLSIPAPVGTGHSGANSVDAPSFGLLSSVPSGTDLNTADASRSAQVHVPVTVGQQPGVTPD